MGVKILSLFDGMACGMIAMQLAGVEVESYDAYEIDKYAIKTAQHNFPMIKEHGDVFDADFTQYEGVDFLIGGSPCTYWSIAQTKNRETVASGMGWELFSQYVRALHEAKPKYFIYENNKSMSKDIRASIDKAFGFEAVLINSALVSAQNRQRLYWVGKRNADGTYSRVNVEQPADRGILLKDVLDNAVAMREKAHAVIAPAGRTTEREFFTKNQGNMVAEPVPLSEREMDYMVRDHQERRWNFCNRPGEKDKSVCITANIHKGVPYNMVAEPVCLRYERTEEAKRCRKAYEAHEIKHGYNELNELHPRPDVKTNTLTTALKDNQIMEPVCVAERGRMYCGQPQHYEARTDGKTNTLTSVEKDNRVAEPINVTANGKAKTISASYAYKDDGEGSLKSELFPDNPIKQTSNYVAVSVKVGYAGYAIEFDDDGKPIKAIGKDGKEITIYEVKDGKITIKGKQYPIKLKDGFYIIRKLTVSECKRLQTVPEWYEFPVSNSQAYKMLGNGWTCEIICHLINSCFKSVDALPGQIGLWG